MNLTRWVSAIEAIIGNEARCRVLGLGHVFEVLSLSRLSERFQGSQEPILAICGCRCCAVTLRDLVGRLVLVGGAA